MCEHLSFGRINGSAFVSSNSDTEYLWGRPSGHPNTGTVIVIMITKVIQRSCCDNKNDMTLGPVMSIDLRFKSVIMNSYELI